MANGDFSAASFPQVDPPNEMASNGADGVVYTEEQTHHGKTFQIKHGCVTLGIFKLDVACTSDENFEFAVGAWGNMGSDGNTTNVDRTHSASWGTLHYNYNSQSGTSEFFYVHTIPKLLSNNDAVVRDSAILFSAVQPSDNLGIWTSPMTHGSTWYFVKGANSTTGACYDWVANDIAISKGVYF